MIHSVLRLCDSDDSSKLVSTYFGIMDFFLFKSIVLYLCWFVPLFLSFVKLSNQFHFTFRFEVQLNGSSQHYNYEFFIIQIVCAVFLVIYATLYPKVTQLLNLVGSNLTYFY